MPNEVETLRTKALIVVILMAFANGCAAPSDVRQRESLKVDVTDGVVYKTQCSSISDAEVVTHLTRTQLLELTSKMLICGDNVAVHGAVGWKRQYVIEAHLANGECLYIDADYGIKNWSLRPVKDFPSGAGGTFTGDAVRFIEH